MADPTSDDAPGDAAQAAPASLGEEGPFSLTAFRQLVELMEKHGLSEVSLKTGETQWKLRRGPEVVPGYPAMPPGYPPPPPVVTPPAAQASSPAAASPAASGVVEGVFIKSPTVGTFYSAASPDDPPFATVGSRVEPDTIVCLVEAMKVFNQIPAEVSGVIAEVLVKNGDSIEFGQPLFRVKS
jgi:acetyl-CoA carboxylase biotin carboxyl carrier protein